MSTIDDNPNIKETNVEKEKNMPDLIDDFEDADEKPEEKEKHNNNNISNGLGNSIENGKEKIKIKEKPKLKKYVPKNEQEAIKARIINIELNEKQQDHIKDNFDFHMNDHLDTAADPNHIEKFKIPPELKKTFIIVMILAVLGVTLIICGFIKAISDATPGGGIMFWVLGTVVIIPGGFYSYQFYKARKAKEEYRRQDILDNIPQL